MSPATFTTDLPPPSNVVVENIGYDSATAVWDSLHNYGDIIVEIRGPDGTWNTLDTYSNTTESHEVTALDESTNYDVRITAQTEHKTSSSTTSFESASYITRSLTVSASTSDTSSSRVLSKPRQLSITSNTVSASTTRDPLVKDRAGTITSGQSSIETTRTVRKNRLLSVSTQPSVVDSSRSVSKTRTSSVHTNPSESHIVSVFTDVLKDGLGKYDVEYDSSKEAFVTEWIDESPLGEMTAFAARLESAVDTAHIRVAVERDDTGDGTVDGQSPWVWMDAIETPTRFPDVGNGAANYRLLLRGADVSYDDFLTGFDIGFIHE